MIENSIRKHIFIGVFLLVLLTGFAGGWASTTLFSGAVIAHGSLVVESNSKRVQHPNGGVVGEVRVREGDHVKAGDVVVRLDDTITKASLAIVSKGLDELTARKARLEAERDGSDSIVFPPDLKQRQDEQALRVMESERRLFNLRSSARAGQKSQLRERIGQLNEEIRGIASQQAAKTQEVTLIRRELEGVRELWEKNLIQLTRLTSLEREAARIDGERAQLVATSAQAKGKITEIELQILQIDQDLRSEVARETRDIDVRIGELTERRTAAEDQLRRVDIRAPQDGIVHQLAVHTVGGVVAAGETLMSIVPASDVLMVEAKVAPAEIDQLAVGQQATLRFVNFNQQTTPEIGATVSRVSADVTTDSRTGANFFTVRLEMAAGEISRLGDIKLLPGMPVEVFIRTSERTVLSFLLKPLTDQISRAFRER